MFNYVLLRRPSWIAYQHKNRHTAETTKQTFQPSLISNVSIVSMKNNSKYFPHRVNSSMNGNKWWTITVKWQCLWKDRIRSLFLCIFYYTLIVINVEIVMQKITDGSYQKRLASKFYLVGNRIKLHTSFHKK